MKKFQKPKSSGNYPNIHTTLASGIDVGPTVINFGFFPGHTALLEST
jgi:hypothetical protein